jgi:hypothetical protein
MGSIWPDKTSKTASIEVDKGITTGSISPAPEIQKSIPFLSVELNDEDQRRARSALALALDPIGAGTAVNWDNPDTRRKGVFIPVGQPFVKNDDICRAFTAQTSQTPSAQPSTLSRVESTLTSLMPSLASSPTSTSDNGRDPLHQQGVACRPSGGDWAIKDLKSLPSS